jgi:hypothetical protein
MAEPIKKIMVGNVSRVVGGKQEEMYQDAVKHPCFDKKPVIETDLANPDGKPNPLDLNSVESKLQRLVDIQGGGNIGGVYRALTIGVPALEQRYEISLGIYATQIIMRCDKDITLVLNDKSYDNIFLQVADFPFSVSDLKLTESIHTLFVTTGNDLTTLKILAFGSSKV